MGKFLRLMGNLFSLIWQLYHSTYPEVVLTVMFVVVVHV
jgi:hypothetical protein